MRAHCAGRLLAASAAGVLLAGGAAIGTAGTAAAAPAVHTHVTTDSCFGHDDGRCFDHGGFRFDHRGFCFNHPGFCFGHRFDHRFFDNRFDRFDNGSVVVIVIG
ncbi:hypothetical protein [Streptomyces diastatochromogenes]|uniref:Uncharacterized protein n=1 Tax=Streptomyces diastatochromogenes TaxID=42236 RepID=A0A233SIK1_STRDA|nr:hypothetical protein [Streptomyces diastatochromogenes]MCZ0988499.1 hypothetical protein [Streptomyces diastatochromogenes]OXY95472.1 hypothetical protein BEK98_15040 [Streptomyces diastatochromogenes]